MSTENKKTAVKIFVKLYNDSRDKDKMIAKYITSTYLPYAMKMAESRRIVERSSNIDVDGKQMFSISSPMRWVLYVVSVITNYTSLGFSSDVMADFDLLNASGAIEAIFTTIGKDLDEYNTVLNMTFDDYLSNNRDIVTFLENKFAALGALIDAVDTAAIEQSMEEEK